MFRSAYANLLLVCCFASGTRQSKVQYSSRLQNICFVRYLVREIYVFRNICFYMPTFMLHEMLSTSANNKTQFPFYQFIKRTKVIMYTVISITSHSRPCSLCTLLQFFSLSCYISSLWRAKRQSSSGHRLALRSLPQKRLECSRPHRGRQCSTWRCPLASVEYVGSTLLLYLHPGVDRNHISPQCSGSFSFDIRHNCGMQTFADPQPLSSPGVVW